LRSSIIDTLGKLNLKTIADAKDRNTEIVYGRIGMRCIIIIHRVWRSGKDDA